VVRSYPLLYHLPYETFPFDRPRADTLVLGCAVLAFLALGEAVLTSRPAQRIDFWARINYPVLFATVAIKSLIFQTNSTGARPAPPPAPVDFPKDSNPFSVSVLYFLT